SDLGAALAGRVPRHPGVGARRLRRMAATRPRSAGERGRRHRELFRKSGQPGAVDRAALRCQRHQCLDLVDATIHVVEGVLRGGRRTAGLATQFRRSTGGQDRRGQTLHAPPLEFGPRLFGHRLEGEQLMIRVGKFEIDYPDDDVARRFRYWALTPRGVAARQEFIAAAIGAGQGKHKMSGYAIVQNIRARFGFAISNDYGPILARLAIAEHPELAELFELKPVGWGKARTFTPDLFDQ